MGECGALTENRRKRFCSDLFNEDHIESSGEMIKPKAKYVLYPTPINFFYQYCFRYMVESLRMFLVADSNFYGLELLDSIINILEKYTDELQKENVYITVMTLLTTDKSKLLKVNDTRIKQLFGDCPFNQMQHLTQVCIYGTS